METKAKLRGMPEPKTLDILFVAYGGGHIQSVVPVAKTLHAHGYSISIFAVTTAIAVANASGLPHFSYSDLAQANDINTQREGTRLASSFPVDGPISSKETRAYLGINFNDLVEQHGLVKAEELYDAAGRQNFFR